MTESTIKASPDEANGSPVAAERITNAPRPKSPLSGGSDNDGSEKPVRERLKKASIAGLSTHGKENEDKSNADDTSAESSVGEGEEIGDEDAMLTDTKSPLRGRPTRKRSFDDLQNESMTSTDAPAHDAATRAGGHHKRMRSKDMSSSRTAAVNGKAEREQVEPLAEEEDDVDARKSPGGAGVMVEPPSMDDNAATSGDQSPKKKRSRDQFDKDHTPEGDPLDKEEHHTVLSQRQPHETEDEAKIANGDKGEPDKKRHRDTSQEAWEAVDTEQMTQTVEKTSGFANTSAISPFGNLSPKSPSIAKKTPEPEAAAKERDQTSSSAFASSGLSAFASSSKSPFGNLGSSSGPGSGSGFGSFGPKPSGGFGSSSGFGEASPFAAKAASGFGNLSGTGFGSALGPGFGSSKTGIYSFAPSGGSSGIIGSGSSSKPFGKSEDDGENEDDDDDAACAKAEDEANERDSRFYEQQTETGEEAEETMFSCRAKLFHFEKEWKERGVGTVKLNIHYSIKEDPDEAPEQKARLIMRTDGVHRVVLNTPVFKGMRFGTPDGKEPNGKTLNLTGMENGKPALFLLRIGKEDVVKELYHRILTIHDGL